MDLSVSKKEKRDGYAVSLLNFLAKVGPSDFEKITKILTDGTSHEKTAAEK